MSVSRNMTERLIRLIGEGGVCSKKEHNGFHKRWRLISTFLSWFKCNIVLKEESGSMIPIPNHSYVLLPLSSLITGMKKEKGVILLLES